MKPIKLIDNLPAVAPSRHVRTIDETPAFDPRGFAIAEAPQSRLPWHIARLCFLPRFADPERTFSIDLKLLAEAVAADSSINYDSSEPAIFVARRGLLRLGVNAFNGDFCIDHIDDEAITAAGDLLGLPENFFEQANQRSFDFLPPFRDDGRALLALSQKLWDVMHYGFRASLRDGSAQVYGRWREIDADFKHIDLDQLLDLDPCVFIDDDGNWLDDFDVRTVFKQKGCDTVLVRSPFVSTDRNIQRSKGNNNEHLAFWHSSRK